MRLIDLDEFLRENCVDRMEGKSCDECKHHVLEVSCERLMEQPTAEKVGKWMETDAAPHRIYCSECYATFIPNKEWVAWKEGIIPRHFCPNCGARMAEGEEDERSDQP